MSMRIIFLLLFACGSLAAQDKVSVVEQAMIDELQRSMKELKSEGNEPPFFINYSIEDVEFYQVTASRGSLTGSIHSKSRAATSIRLLIGDYNFNDESFDEPTYGQSQSVDISLPIDDDYLGIRRSLWISTDNLYRSASKQFAKNKEALKEQGKPLSELPHRTFAKVPPSKISKTLEPFPFDRTAVEEFLRKVTAVSEDHKDILGVHATFNYNFGYHYQVNSEGTNNRIPISQANLLIRINMRNDEGEAFQDKLDYQWRTPVLPSADETISRLKVMMEELIQASKAPKFTDEYVGPVLFLDNNVASLFEERLMGEGGLMQSNAIASLNAYYNPPPGMEAKIGKPLYAPNMTIAAAPKMKKYGDVELLGGYEVDGEGVVPADETILVEGGILKELMNDRSLTKPDQRANGLADGPGVAIVRFRNTIALADMKARLIAQARKDGLDYGILVKRNQTMGLGRRTVFDVYKVYVADGKEEFVREAAMNQISQRDFKKILEASTENSVHHVSTMNGSFTSLICPRGILLEEIEFKPSETRARKEQVYVPNPLKK